MLKAIVSIILLSMLPAATLAANVTAKLSPWKLVWSDEFNYSGLPDPSKWNYEEGLVRNDEPQYYMRADRDNSLVSGGVLTLTARKEVVPNPKYDQKTTYCNWRKQAEYSSASIVTDGRESWTYGRFEMRARLPYGNGTWPAFWTLGISRSKIGWPGCGEVDIMEYTGKDPNVTTSNVHFKKDGVHKSRQGKLTVDKPWQGFHIYAMEWYPDRMDFFFDDKKFHTVKLDGLDDADVDAFHKPHYIVLNLAIGQYGGKIDESTLPQKFIIDYVRVYQKDKY